MTVPPNSLGELCLDYRSMQVERQQLELRIACCTRYAEHSLLMCERLVQLRQQQSTLLAGQRTTARAIHRCTADLDERLRTIIELRYLDGMPWAQVSELMGLELRWLMRLHKRALGDK